MHLSTSTFGAGMIVGARIAIPALVVGLIGKWQTPYLVSIGWLKPDEPFRKIGFIIALGTILGAAILDLALILIQAARRFRQKSAEPAKPAEDWKRVNMLRLVLWVLFWGAATVVLGSQVLHQPVFFLAVAVGLCFLFVLVNGISLGISDWNPISSAFVLTVFILAALGLRDPGVGLMCASILLIACSEGRRHAAGPLDRLAAGHQPRRAVPLPGHRHRHGRGAGGGAGQGLHGLLPGAARGPVGDEGGRAAMAVPP